jgi:hypothetical protein
VASCYKGGNDFSDSIKVLRFLISGTSISLSNIGISFSYTRAYLFVNFNLQRDVQCYS